MSEKEANSYQYNSLANQESDRSIFICMHSMTKTEGKFTICK